VLIFFDDDQECYEAYNAPPNVRKFNTVDHASEEEKEELRSPYPVTFNNKGYTKLFDSLIASVPGSRIIAS